MHGRGKEERGGDGRKGKTIKEKKGEEKNLRGKPYKGPK